ncbi:hypothetical protein BUALT_Bualt01G0163500 [Buddleja alternifolia]|uniref:Uncharacterized protein n=1 Tax=Buddleja alternifolia TaxID=168488 RepID=A0AAV6YEM6_9LAMI|nr:hypothetical protein BUALT_Bualt01G0163500 [Buddleja alternifolia]
MITQNENSTNHHIVTFQEFAQLLESHGPREKHGGSSRRRIHRVPPQIRSNRNEIYDPMAVSLGPYHHGKPDLRRAQEFKYTSLDWCASGSDHKKRIFYNKVLEIIHEIRDCYADISSVDKYDDKALALMMLLDACFIINFMETRTRRENNFHEWRDCLGMAAAISFTSCDIMVLENQIPFKVIKLLIGLRYGERKEGKQLIHEFLGWILVGKSRLCRIPREEEEPPLHILEAYRRVIVEEKSSDNEPSQQPGIAFNFRWPQFMRRRSKKKEYIYDQTEWISQTGRSVMDLKAKGIKFRPSSFGLIREVKFKSFAFHGQLQLPMGYLSERTRVILSNMIAYEISPDSNTDLAVLSFASFMKSLIQSPSDVKELQERGIWLNKFSNNEEVVKFIKEINTFGLVNFSNLDYVNQRIREHCDNKAKTWMADLIHTRFRSPWTVIALLAAILLLCLTFLQTYFNIHPAQLNQPNSC